ncbi:carboxymuconolactone decarboxylase family protein [Paenibacillus sp. GYB003]
MNDERYAKGLKIFEEMAGPDGLRAVDGVRKLCPDMAELMVSNGFGDIYTRPGLDLRQRELVTLSSLITQGATEQLPMHVHAALNVGLTPEEIVEVVLQCTAYAGFPKALSAFQIVMEQFRQRNVAYGGAEQKVD